MHKDDRQLVTDYVAKLPEDNLRFLYVRLVERVGLDLADAVNFTTAALDTVFSKADSAAEFYDYCDILTNIVRKAAERRDLIVYPLPGY